MLRPVQEMRHRCRVVSFLHLRPLAIIVSYLNGDIGVMSETVQKHLCKSKSAWHELAVTTGGPSRRTMIWFMLGYLIVTATLFYYSRNIASTSLRTLLGDSL